MYTEAVEDEVEGFVEFAVWEGVGLTWAVDTPYVLGKLPICIV